MWLTYLLLAVFVWSLASVVDSIIVRNFEKDPIVIMWFISVFSLVMLGVMLIFFDVRSTWMYPLIIVGILAYLGDILFFYILDRIDVSVVNVAWALQAIGISIGAFIIFNERWTLLESGGAILVIGGVVLVSLYHQHVSMVRTVSLLSLLALLYIPFFLMHKAALLDNQSIASVFFWSMASREAFSVLVASSITRKRKRVVQILKACEWRIILLGFIAATSFWLGDLFGTMAYDLGPASLISVSWNVQPFVVMFLAWFIAYLWPTYVSKELFTKQSIQIKILSFSVVFIGMTMIAIR